MTFPQIVKIHDLFMTIQVSDSDSGLFRFIHDCGHPEFMKTSVEENTMAQPGTS